MNLLTVLLISKTPAISLSFDAFSGLDPVVSSVVEGGDRPIVGLRFTSTGEAQTASGDTGTSLSYSQAGSDYLINDTNGSLYELRVQQTSSSGAGTLTTTPFALNTWVALGTTRTIEFSKDTNVAGIASTDLTIEIREAADVSNIISVTNFTLRAEASL